MDDGRVSQKLNGNVIPGTGTGSADQADLNYEQNGV